MLKLFLYFISAMFIISCNESDTPKPKAYFRIDLPTNEYIPLEDGYPFKFNYSKIAIVKKATEDANWLNIVYPSLKATIYLTYKKIDNNLETLTEQTRTFAYKHTLKAESITETQWIKPDRQLFGLQYDIKGNTASSVNFYLTDSTTNYISGALYFHTKPNRDSLFPVINFIKADINMLIESFEWK
jgi:gliding motility-associated lipoprotein GldD